MSSSLSGTSPNRIRAGWINCPDSDHENSETDEPTYLDLREESRKRIMTVMFTRVRSSARIISAFSTFGDRLILYV